MSTASSVRSRRLSLDEVLGIIVTTFPFPAEYLFPAECLFLFMSAELFESLGPILRIISLGQLDSVELIIQIYKRQIMKMEGGHTLKI